MKAFKILNLSCALFLVHPGTCAENFDAAIFVNPFIGSGKYCGPSKWGKYGGTYPGAVVPFGMVQVTPETRQSGDPLGYYYEDDRIYTFSVVNHMSGYPNGSAGNVNFMPFFTNDSAQVFSSFSHNKEKAEPGFYVVDLYDGRMLVELTATERTAFIRLSLKDKSPLTLGLLDVDSLSQSNSREFRGKCGGYFFVLQTSQPGKNNQKNHLLFESHSQLLFKVAVSKVSIKNAKENLNAENSGWDFEHVKTLARKKWNECLGKIEIKGSDDQKLTVFYTALYHSMLLPFVSSDNNGEYLGEDNNVYQCESGDYYSGFSPWDTFRTLHPLLTLLQPDRQEDMVKSLLLMYQKTGKLYDGPMTGNHAIAVIVDSYNKGLTNFDGDVAVEAMKSAIWTSPYMKSDFESYLANSFVPADLPESVTRTLEYAYNDWVLGEFIKNVQPEISDQLIKRSLNYRTLFNPATGLMSPKFRDGVWSSKGGYKEGDAWNYSWFVPHNIKDLINLMGGEDEFCKKLDTGFAEGKIIHDNEPVLNFAYLFNYAGKTWKTNQQVAALRTLYSNTEGGIPGNDDLGSMSSWFVFSALGLFPVCPGKPIYDLTSPLFSDVTIYLQNNHTLKIRAYKDTSAANYIQSVQFNNTRLTTPWIDHTDLINGGTLVFDLVKKPIKSWANFAKNEIPSWSRKSPEFEITGFSIDKTSVLPNELFKIKVDVKNKGALGSLKLTLFVDDVAVANQLLLVKKGEKETAIFPQRLYKADEHQIRINAVLVGTITVLESPQYLSFQYSNFNVEPIVKVGELVTAEITLKNIGSKTRSEQIPLIINNKKIDEKLVKLAPGVQQTIHLEFIPRQKGMNTISINDSLFQPVKFYSKPIESAVLDLSFDEINDNKFFDKSGFNQLVTLAGEAKSVKGKIGKGIQTGPNGFIDIAQSPALNISGKNLSILAWIKPDNEGVADFISQGDYNVLKMQNPTTLNFIAGGWGRGECMAPVAEDWNDTWHHIAGVCDSNSLKLYIDGELAQAIEIDGELEWSEFPWNIGRNAEIPVGRRTNGFLDEVKIFKDALSSDDILKIMNEGKVK